MVKMGDIHEVGSTHDAARGLPVKAVLVGDVAVGKTSLIVSYTTNGYPTEYTPTALDEYSVFVEVEQQPIRFQLVDTAGQEEFRNLRQLCYTKADVILLCFSVVMPSSLQNCTSRWLHEISQQMCRDQRPLPPLLLVGTQIERRSDAKVALELQRRGESFVSEEQGRAVAAKFGMQQYLECSALTQRQLKQVFDEALLTALRHKCKNHIVSSLMLNSHKEQQMSFLPRLSPRSSRKILSKTTKKFLPSRMAEPPTTVASNGMTPQQQQQQQYSTTAAVLGKSNSNSSGMTSSTRASVSSTSNGSAAAAASITFHNNNPDLITDAEQQHHPLIAKDNKKPDFLLSLSPVPERKNETNAATTAGSTAFVPSAMHQHQLYPDNNNNAANNNKCKRCRRCWKRFLCCR